jgi:hypothetical protein
LGADSRALVRAFPTGQKHDARGRKREPRASFNNNAENQGQQGLEAAVAIDAARRAVLLPVDHPAIVRSEAAMIGGAHGANLMMNGALATLDAECLAASELTGANTGGDAVLLVDLTLCDVIIAVGHLRLRQSRSAEKYSRCDCDC